MVTPAPLDDETLAEWKALIARIYDEDRRDRIRFTAEGGLLDMTEHLLAEVQRLRAEVERLAEVNEKAFGDLIAGVTPCSCSAQRAARTAAEQALAVERERIARVEALRDKWRQYADGSVGIPVPERGFASQLDAALDPAPTTDGGAS